MNEEEIIEKGLTDRLRNQFVSGMEKINVLYCREDLERALNSLMRAPADARPSRRKALERMCKALGIDMADLLSNSSLLNEIPRRSDLLAKIYDLVHSMYLQVPSPEKAMERIVRNLAPEYENDPVRLAILKKMVAGAGFDCRTIVISGIAEWTLDRMSESFLAEYEAAEDDKVRLYMIIDNLNEEIFKMPNSVGLDLHTELKLIIKKTESFIKDYDTFYDDEVCIISDIKIGEKAADSLKSYCRKKSIPYKDGDNILEALRTILKVCKYDLSDLSPCLSLIKEDYENWLKNIYYISKGYYRPLLTLYQNSRKDEEKKAAKIWLPVKLADDFANGIFRTNNGQTREFLYWFAILLGMTAVLKPGDHFDSKKDIVKNLFEDYYCDNLMRYFCKSYKDADNLTIFEKEPAGEGINYKNFVEMIYLYFMNKIDSELTPGQKIDHSQSCIEKCIYFSQKVNEYANAKKITLHSEDEEAKQLVKSFNSKALRKYKEAAEKEDQYAARLLSDTTYYRDDCLPEILELDEDELPEYVFYHFLVNPKYIPAGSIPRIMISSSEQTAYGILTETMEDVREVSEYMKAEEELVASQKRIEEEEEDEIQVEESLDALDETAADNLKFFHDFSDELIKKYSSEKSFVDLVEHIRQRIGNNIDLTAGSGTKIMAAVLQALYNADGGYLSNEDIQKKIKYSVGSVNGININRSIRTLQELGFVIGKRIKNKTKSRKRSQEYRTDVEKQKKAKGRPEYVLEQTEYDNDLMTDIIDYISENRAYEFDEAVYLLNDLIFMQNNISGRPTRNTMITALAVNFQNNFEYEYRMALPDIYRNFAAQVNPLLSEARFQVLNEKIYLIFSLFAQFLLSQSINIAEICSPPSN